MEQEIQGEVQIMRYVWRDGNVLQNRFLERSRHYEGEWFYRVLMTESKQVFTEAKFRAFRRLDSTPTFICDLLKERDIEERIQLRFGIARWFVDEKWRKSSKRTVVGWWGASVLQEGFFGAPEKRVQHKDFPRGHTSQYYSHPSTLNCKVLMGSDTSVLA
ncbi:hypothetical protein Scep_024780 [Stephania cephalantha]|uniref:Uncharacterized protein n=1 Tax=Stephania cephalantha TaxID=152367 RepID=A0AAP0EX75_9MAGN